jgi:hypothetical protein
MEEFELLQLSQLDSEGLEAAVAERGAMATTPLPADAIRSAAKHPARRLDTTALSSRPEFLHARLDQNSKILRGIETTKRGYPFCLLT